MVLAGTVIAHNKAMPVKREEQQDLLELSIPMVFLHNTACNAK